MRRVLGGVMVVVLCSAVDGGSREEPADGRLMEARAAFEDAVKLQKEGRYSDALRRATQALILREQTLGEADPEVATSLNLAGHLHLQTGDPAHAEPLLRRALEIRESVLGSNHPLVADSLGSLANLYRVQGLNKKVEPLYRRALDIQQATLGKGHPRVALTLNNLAAFYASQGLYDEAEPLLQRALAIREAALGESHLDVAFSLNNLASLYGDRGRYDLAEPLLHRALAIRETALGQGHPDVATSLSSLAKLYQAQGMHGHAEPLFERALGIRSKALGKTHPKYADALNELANLHAEQEVYERAEPLYRQALAIYDAAPAGLGPEKAAVLSNLATLHLQQGAYRRARPLAERALAMNEQSFGKNHPYVANTLHGLAAIFHNLGLPGRAEPLYLRALEIREATLGRDHPDVANSLQDLALLRLNQGRLEDALALLARAFTISEGRLRKEALDFSEPRLDTFLRSLRSSQERLYAVLRAYPGDVRVQRLALAATLLLKGRSLEESAAISHTISHSLDSSDRASFERLRGVRTQLAALSLAGPGRLEPAEYQRRLKDLIDEGDILETDIARRSAALRSEAALPVPDQVIDRVAASLPTDAALIEIAVYNDRPGFPRAGAAGPRAPGQPRYLAFVLFPDARIRTIDLGPASVIDREATHLRSILAERNPFRAAAESLHRRTLRPLLPFLGNVRRLFLAPDGQLSLVPFAVLSGGDRSLVDSFDLTYLTSGKDLLRHASSSPPSSAVVVFADPSFNFPVPIASPPGATPDPPERVNAVERFFSSRGPELAAAAASWASLPGTREEALSIQRLLPRAQVFVGPDASKAKFLRLPTPGVLHIATHGFFLEDPASPAATRGLGHFDVPGGAGLAQPPPGPLLRSGLVFAGAGVQPGEPTSFRPADSLATALELAGLDLWGTQLVVLSACDTGRGDVKLGQGIYGLRRAFIVAGAETVVTSLWKVNDETTRTFMEIYYRRLLGGAGRTAALRDAMLALRQQQPHPYFWAPFISIGKDTPLLGFTSPETERPGQGDERETQD